ncbi:YidC/Oxa1 family membrane protein insertase [Streptomyces sp. NPDC050610]|uniref:YidC/Oxa1 family membrane protein insertase n=1 Tax=Streptomyces sp. NPDC050610 TaxID=3157097 RepID=UPI003438FE72
MSVFTSLFAAFGALLSHCADLLEPLFGHSATAATIIVFTCCVRLALHPLARSAARGERVRAELAPRMAEVRRKHRNAPETAQRAVGELYKEAGASPLAGCLPMLVQLPVFSVMYHLFSSGSGGAGLLDHTLLGAPLGGRWAGALGDGGVFGPWGLVYLGLFALVGAVATWTYTRARKAAAASAARTPAGGAAGAPAVPGLSGIGLSGVGKVLPLMAFGTLVSVAVVPLAAGLYLATSTAWTAAERALLQRVRAPRPEAERRPGAGAGA